jgi:putative endonuclease
MGGSEVQFQMFYAYVLQNLKGVLYKGSTDNTAKRLEQHNSNNGFLSFTAKRGPWKLVYVEEFKTRKEAEEREKYFKSGAGRRFLKEKIKTQY